MLRSVFKTLITNTLIIFATSFGTYGQTTTASIAGTVIDQNGAVVADAQIIAKQITTGQTRNVTTNGQGNFNLPALAIGPYALTVEKNGFGKESLTGITLQIDDKLNLKVVLKPGVAQEQINVTAALPLLNASSAEISEVIDNRRILVMPLNGRQFLELALLTSGVNINAKGSTGDQLGAPNAPRITVNGMRESSNNFTIDGVRAFDRLYNSLSFNPSVDAIQEFKVQSSAFAAEYGNTGGSQINIAIKQGTNQFHGSAYEFVRNNVFDARNFFDADKLPPFRQNQFGGTVGGPVLKNKLFFFGNYEGLRVRKSLTRAASVPTAAQRAGDLRSLVAAGTFLRDLAKTGACNATDQTACFANNIIPEARLDRIARAYLGLYPLENAAGRSLNFIGTPKSMLDFDQTNIRVDANLTGRDVLYGRVSYGDTRSYSPFGFTQFGAAAPEVPGFGTENAFTATNLVLNYQRVWSANLISQVRFGFNRVDGGQIIENLGSNFVEQNGIRGLSLTDANRGIPRVAPGTFAPLGDSVQPITRTSNDWEIAPSVTYLKGAHTFKFGGELRRTYIKQLYDVFTRGQYFFTGAFTGNSFADFLLGKPLLTLSAVGDLQHRNLLASAHGFAQDDWKVNSKLTLNLGLRYEWNGRPIDRQDRWSTLVFDQGYVNPRFVIPDNAARELFLPSAQRAVGNLSFVTASQSGLNIGKRSLVKEDTNNFGPRVGLAWMLNDKTVVRAGGGIYFEPPTLNAFLTTSLSPPYGLLGQNFNLTGAQDFTNSFNPLASLLFFPFDPKIEDATIYQWNLTVQRELGRDFAFEAQYVGTRGINLFSSIIFNIAKPPSSTPIANRRLIPAFGNVALQESTAYSSYHGGTMKLTKRMSQGHTFIASYTWAKSLDVDSLNQNTANFGSFQDVFNKRLEYGRSTYDIRQRFVMNYGWDLPFGTGRRWLHPHSEAVAFLVSNWQAQGIVSLRSGLPLTVCTNTDPANTGRTSCFSRPDQVRNPNLTTDQRTPNKWFDTSAFSLAFAQPGATREYRYGTAGRNTVDGPGSATWDFSLLKQGNVTEQLKLEFRAEVFNLLNRANFGIPDRAIESRTFGQIFQTATDSRQVQFGLKLLF